MAESSSSSSSPASTPTPIAEIDHGPSKLDEFLEKNQKKLLLGAILIALAVIAYVVWDGIEEGKAVDSGSALQASQKIAEYQDVIKQWPESNAAASALPLIADLQWADSQPDSIKTLQQFIAEHPEHPSVATAKVSLGLRFLAQGKADEAKETLTEVDENEAASYIAPLAQITLGDIAKDAGKIDEAKAWYEKAQKEPSTYKNTAIARLALVDAKPPTKIKPALPEPATPPPAPPLTQPSTPAAPEAAPTEPSPAPQTPEAPASPEPAKTPQTPTP